MDARQAGCYHRGVKVRGQREGEGGREGGVTRGEPHKAEETMTAALNAEQVVFSGLFVFECFDPNLCLKHTNDL